MVNFVKLNYFPHYDDTSLVKKKNVPNAVTDTSKGDALHDDTWHLTRVVQ